MRLYLHNLIDVLGLGHFRVPQGLCFKKRLSAQPLIWKLCFILMQNLIFTRKNCALGLILKVRVFGTRKLPNCVPCTLVTLLYFAC